jgi:hypothetical protein
MENKKNILLSIYNIDFAENSFHGKLKFMNFAHLIANLNKFSDEQISECASKLAEVESIICKVNNLVSELEQPALNLIKAYNPDEFKS